MTLKFDEWPRKITGHLIHAPRSYVCHSIAICEFKLELLSGNAQIKAKTSIVPACVTLTDELNNQ